MVEPEQIEKIVKEYDLMKWEFSPYESIKGMLKAEVNGSDVSVSINDDVLQKLCSDAAAIGIAEVEDGIIAELRHDGIIVTIDVDGIGAVRTIVFSWEDALATEWTGNGHNELADILEKWAGELRKRPPFDE